jgi:hypothetical protein
MVVCLGIAAPASARPSATGAAHRLQAPGSQAWISRYKAARSGEVTANAMAVSPRGSAVFVAGGRLRTTNDWNSWDFLTVAYDADSGSQVWAAQYDGPAHNKDFAYALRVSPDGATVFVTGSSLGKHSADIVTIAYDASTGAKQWIARYDDPLHLGDMPYAMSMSPDGTRVFVTGQSGSPIHTDFVTLAYGAHTGSLEWEAHYNGPGDRADSATAIRVNPAGDAVFVTGQSGGLTSPDYATVAYDASTGAQLWSARYDGTNRADEPNDLGLSPDGRTVVVTGDSYGSASPTHKVNMDIATVAYDASSGLQMWVRRYDDPLHGDDYANALAVSPTRNGVFIVGSSGLPDHHDSDYMTLAYSLSGSLRWTAHYDGPLHKDDAAVAVGVSPDGSTVFVTGQSAGSTPTFDPSFPVTDDYATLAYDASSGSQLWLARYDGPGNAFDSPWAMAVSPVGTKVFVTGDSAGKSRSELATIAYSA